MLYIGADHGGFHAKEKLKKFFKKNTISFTDIGAHTYDAGDDFPEIAQALARAVAKNTRHRGILLCGSGQGVCIAANKVRGIRAAQSWNAASSRTARHDDDANIICLGGRLLSQKIIQNCVATWLSTPFSGLARHRRRIKKIEN